jgi:hypothetical protein
MPDIMKKMLSKETTVYYMEHNFILSSAHEAQQLRKVAFWYTESRILPTNHLHISLLSTNKPFAHFSSVYQQTIYTFLLCLPTNHLHISLLSTNKPFTHFRLDSKIIRFFYVFVGLSHFPFRREKVSISCKVQRNQHIFVSYLSVLNLNVTTGDYI